MVQGVSLSTLTSCGKGRLYGSTSSWTAPFRPFKKSQISFINERYCVWNQCQQSLFLTKCHRISRLSGLKVEAGWIFRRGKQESEALIERSEIANDDILIFIFQLNMAIRVQVRLPLLLFKQLKNLVHLLNLY